MIEQENQIENQIRFVSHEIRNNLSICDMYSQIIKRNLEKEGITNPSIENALNCIQRSIQIIGANLTDLKSINVNTPKIYDFKTQVLQGVELSKACVEDKEIDFDVFIKNSANICIDENRLQSCIVNIIKNGIEAIEIKGKISVYGQVKDGFAVLRIANNGKPIPKDKQELIFNNGFTTKEKGCGFGLCICKQYLESQNCKLNLLKSTKTDTVFEISIPLCIN